FYAGLSFLLAVGIGSDEKNQTCNGYPWTDGTQPLSLRNMESIYTCEPTYLCHNVMRHILFPETSQAISRPSFQIEATGA
ncbi:MAG: hypothetical protein WA627_18215, partial [Candidatus Sulfotelmatobacter sp.]